MARANRYMVPGQIYHVTHRCHNRSFLFRFRKDRDAYRSMLRDRVSRFPVSVLGYCLTSNHTHLLLKVNGLAHRVLASLMQALEGDFAQYYNLRKKRKGAFWSDRYHAVMIDRGDYLWRCLCYIDLNMVRAGVVESPAEWAWCGYQEMAGLRKRYRIVDQTALSAALAPGQSWTRILEHYKETIEAAITAKNLSRESCWTESLAVGGPTFIGKIKSRIPNRIQVETACENGVWVVREPSPAYELFSASKKSSKSRYSVVEHV